MADLLTLVTGPFKHMLLGAAVFFGGMVVFAGLGMIEAVRKPRVRK